LNIHFGNGVDAGGTAEIPAASAIAGVDAVDVERLSAPSLDVGYVGRETAAKRFLIVGEQRHTGKDLQKRDRIASSD
jgi:hypothetical protein